MVTKPVFFGLGIGPGDIELMTLKAARILNEAAVLYCVRKWPPFSPEEAIRVP